MKGLIIMSLSSVASVVCFPGQNSSCSVMNLLLLRCSKPITCWESLFSECRSRGVETGICISYRTHKLVAATVVRQSVCVLVAASLPPGFGNEVPIVSEYLVPYK